MIWTPLFGKPEPLPLGGAQREAEIERLGKEAPFLEARLDRPITKNDLFLKLRIPFELLDPVIAAIVRDGRMDFALLGASERDQLERERHDVIVHALRERPKDQKRGPRFLLVYGQTYRGKTTFLTFALALIAGRTIDPLSAKTFFKEGFIRKALSYRTTFPLIFDDMATISSAQFEGVVKNYWEKDWTGRDPVPQLVFSTNRMGLRQSVISRVKKVYFPVYIEPTPQKKKVLNQLRERESSNHLFEWFAHAYLELLSAQKDPPPEDELFLARSALQRLYSYAGRPLPDFFPSTPFEELYDTREAEWKDLLFGLKKADVRDTGGRILIEFHEDMSRDDILPYATMLPLATDHQETGNTIVIRSPALFRKWLSLPELASQQLPAAPSAPVQPRGLGAKLRSLLGRFG